MKKLLGILIVGLLLGGCADSSGVRPFGPQNINLIGTIIESDENFIKIVVDKSVTGKNYSHNPDGIPAKKAEEHCAKYKKFVHIYHWDFDGDAAYYRCYSELKIKNAKGRELLWTNHPEGVWEIAKLTEEEIKKKQEEELEKYKKEKKDKEQIKVTSMIDDAKNTCKTIGFKEDTEKFTDCALKLYTQKVELAAEKKQTIIQSSGLSGGSVTIYDPVRDNNALIKRGQGLINGTCTLGDLSNC